MIARRVPASPITPGVLSDDPSREWRLWFARAVAICGALLLTAAVGVALYAAVGGARVPRDVPYRWSGPGPVHVAIRSGEVTCAYSAPGGPRRVTVTGYDLVLAGVIRGRTLQGRAGTKSPNILICDRPVTVTGGSIVQAYPLAGSWARFVAYLLATLLGAVAARRRHPSGAAGEAAAGEAGDRGASPRWATINVQTARIRAEAAIPPMRFRRTNHWGRRLIDATAGLMAFVASLGVLPLLVVIGGGIPPDYVTYPLVAGVSLGCYALLRRKLYDYRVGHPWHPKPRSALPSRPPPRAQSAAPKQGAAGRGNSDERPPP